MIYDRADIFRRYSNEPIEQPHAVKRDLSADLAAQMEAFQARGGRIQKIPTGQSAYVRTIAANTKQRALGASSASPSNRTSSELSTTHAAEYLGLSPRRLMALIEAGEGPRFLDRPRSGALQRRFVVADLDEWRAQRGAA